MQRKWAVRLLQIDNQDDDAHCSGSVPHSPRATFDALGAWHYAERSGVLYRTRDELKF